MVSWFLVTVLSIHPQFMQTLATLILPLRRDQRVGGNNIFTDDIEYNWMSYGRVIATLKK